MVYALRRLLELSCGLYRSPALSILRFANVATPFTAFTGALPESVPPAGLLSMAIEMAPVKLVTVFPDASRDRKGVVEGKGVDPGGRLVIKKKKKSVAGGGGAAVKLNELLLAWGSVLKVKLRL